MRKITLTEIDLDELLQSFRVIVKEEIKAEHSQQLQEKLLTVKETCELLKVSKVTLASWAKQERLQEHRIAGRVYFKHAEVMSSLTTLKKYKKVSAN